MLIEEKLKEIQKERTLTNSERTTLKRINYKKRIVKCMGGKCCICGYDKYYGALELHHLKPEEKSFAFSDATYKAWETLKEEMKKCTLLCANCHREVEAGIVELDLISSFNEEIYNLIQEEINNIKKKSEQSYCQFCGNLVTKNNDTCVTCASLKRRTVERPDRETLKNLIRNNSFTSIAIQYKVSDNAIRKWCDSYNLPRKVKDIKNYSDEEWNLI